MTLSATMPSKQKSVPSSGTIVVPKDMFKKHDGIFTDTCNFLDHKMLAHMGVWSYLNGGRPYLEAFFSSADYDGKKEEDLIPVIGAQFAQDLPQKISLIELGPGKAYKKKTSDFIDSFMKAANGRRIVEYHAVDVVEDYAAEAAKYVNEKYKIHTDFTVADFAKIKEPFDCLGTPVLISWNSPVWNAPIAPDVDPDFIYASNLKRLGQLITPDGTLIITHFPLRDPDQAFRIYNNEDCKNAVLAIPRLIDKRLAPECSTPNGEKLKFSELFEYKVNINTQHEFISMDLISIQDAQISMGEYQTALRDSEEFNPVRSAKPSIRRFNNISRMSGGNVINTLQNSEGSVVAQALQFPSFNR